METFNNIINQYDWNATQKSILSKSSRDVEEALSNPHKDMEDFKSLLSPAAIPYLEQMAKLSRQLTLKRFGKTIQLYIPLYLSNVCENECLYCGYNRANAIKRITLTDEEILKEIEIIKSFGFRHILLVTGESRYAGVEYLNHVLQLIRSHFSLISIEVQPLEQKEYELLISSGLNSVYLYQETYNRIHYKNYHLFGKKTDFDFRLDTYERLGRSGVHKIGLGVLLGLEDWRTDSFFTALHLKYLQKRYWKTKYSVSFPRLRPHSGNFEPNCTMTERELLQLICAYRIFDEYVELSLSTRESEKFRNHAFTLGITAMSAGSKTEPGGYAIHSNALKQFEPDDNRSPAEIKELILSQGYEAVWKDWDVYMQMTDSN